MRNESLEAVHVRIRPTGAPAIEVPLRDGGHDVGGVHVEVRRANDRVDWSVAGNETVALDAVGIVWDAGPASDDTRLFVNGYQSWAETRTKRLGVDVDPSHDERGFALVRAGFHADPTRALAGELRSEQVAVLARDRHAPLCIGFLGGDHHAGTIRARIVDGKIEVCTEAWLGGAQIDAGTTRELHPIVLDEDDGGSELLERWAARAGAVAGARTTAPFQIGWCSWYHYFDRVTETALLDNLARADTWPFDVFQLDDGYQRAIGDWLLTNDKFPSGVEGVAAKIAAGGCTPGIWIAPFLAAPDSALVHDHPEWLAGAPGGDGFAIGMFNETWGGVMAELDTTNPDVLDHLAHTAAALVGAGYRYLKLDFTFSAAMPGRYVDPTRTPAERVRAGFDAIRRGAGDDVFILGCGAPLGATVGVVDGMRIGADVAPWWDPPSGKDEQLPGYEANTASTHHAFVNTCTRSFMHRRLWLNDPDCVMLRTADTELSAAAARTWAETVGCSGGMVLVSDDLALLDANARRLLDDVVARGRRSDAGAITDRPPRCDDLLSPREPRGVRGAGGAVDVDPATGEGSIRDG